MRCSFATNFKGQHTLSDSTAEIGVNSSCLGGCPSPWLGCALCLPSYSAAALPLDLPGRPTSVPLAKSGHLKSKGVTGRIVIYWLSYSDASSDYA